MFLNSFNCLVMKLAKFCVLGGLACVLVLLELPPLNGRYLLVELEDTAEIEDTAAAWPCMVMPCDPWRTGKSVTKCSKFASPLSLTL